MSDLFRNVLEIGFGFLYLIGAIFNYLYTLRHSDEFYGSFADKAILSFSRKFIRKVVIPRSKIFTGLLISFQLLVALSILSRGNLADLGLFAGGIFCFIALFMSNVTGAIANLLMAVAQIFLAFT